MEYKYDKKTSKRVVKKTAKHQLSFVSDRPWVTPALDQVCPSHPLIVLKQHGQKEEEEGDGSQPPALYQSTAGATVVVGSAALPLGMVLLPVAAL